ncbi:MAG: alpha/beta hydrolase [Chloroflexota bacterium]
MTSLRSQWIYLLMKNRHLLHFRLKEEAWDWNTSIPKYREECERASRAMAGKMPPGVEVSPFSLENMRAEWLLPAGAGKEKVVLYMIGGGYVSGSCDDHRFLVSKVADCSGVPVLMFDHRLAPEHPFPAALEDAVTAYRWLLAQGTAPQNIVIMGESAGGGLCLATLLALRDRGFPLPAGGVALSPWTDLKLTGESYRTKAKVCMSPPGMSIVCSKYYAGDHDPADPWISPLYGDLHGLPPLFINVGEYETMLDDSTRFAAKAQAAGVDVTLVVAEKMIHCYPLLAPMFPEATQAMNEICAFIRGRLRSSLGNVVG